MNCSFSFKCPECGHEWEDQKPDYYILKFHPAAENPVINRSVLALVSHIEDSGGSYYFFKIISPIREDWDRVIKWSYIPDPNLIIPEEFSLPIPKDPVYCEDCKNYSRQTGLVFFTQEHICSIKQDQYPGGSSIYKPNTHFVNSDPISKNIKNDCKDFVRNEI
jgi:hypothetical protein